MRILNVCAALSCAAVFSVGASNAAAATIESFDNGRYSQANNVSNDFTAGAMGLLGRRKKQARAA